MSAFYARLRKRRGGDAELASCVERVVNRFESSSTCHDRPGILLGKIQLGETREFVGAMAQAFERGFDIAIVLTKGNRTLPRRL